MAVKQKKYLRVLTAVLVLMCTVAVLVLGYMWYDEHVDRSGWVMQFEQYHYRDFHNHDVTGWQEIDGARYYFDREGVMQTGWLELDGEKYFLRDDGQLSTLWMNHDGHRYFLGEDGAMQTGLITDGGKIYLLNEEGHLLTGKQEYNGETYLLTKDGSAYTGAYEEDGKNYLFSEGGRMVHGWNEEKDGRRYYLEDGAMALGLQEIGEKTYYFNSDTGLPRTGWLQDEEYRYYFGEDGAALTGPQVIEDRKYYFTPKGIEVLLVNASNPLPDDYDPDLQKLSGWHRISRVALDPMRRMLTECKLSGKEPEINSVYRPGKNQELIMEDRIQQFMKDGLSLEQASAKAATIVAAPGTSEHETGLSADLVGEEAKKWLAEHCWEYGFILRYPEEKGDITGITFEPWHFRYVGKRVSMDMKDSGLCLEEYLGAGPAKP